MDMDSMQWIRVLLLMLVWKVSPVLVMSHSYYIIPVGTTCTDSDASLFEECLTLQKFANRVNNGSSIFIGESISLTFASGRHFLTGGAMFNDITQVILKGQFDGITLPRISCEDSCFVFHDTPNVTIERLMFTECTSENFDAGAIFIQRAQLVIIAHSLFVNNFVRKRGGAIRIRDTAEGHVLHSQFINNSAICHPSDINANSTCSDSCFGAPGALAIVNCSLLLISDSTFDRNTASCFSGAIFSASSTLSLFNTTLSRNIVTAVDGLGGAMLLFSSHVEISECVFSENQAYRGGALYSSNSTLRMSNSVLKDNLALHGGVLFSHSQTNALISKSVFKENQAVQDGGAIFSLLSQVQVRSCLFSSNKAQQFGGVAFFGVSFVTMENTTCRNNTAYIGGAVHIDNGNQDHAVVSNCTFEYNIANSGGAMSLYLDGLPGCTTNCENITQQVIGIETIVSIVQTAFKGNGAQLIGGAVYVTNGLLTVTSNTFSENTGRLGGAIKTLSTVFYLSENVFTGNSATVFGNALHLSNGIIRSVENRFVHNIGPSTVYEFNSTFFTVRDQYISNMGGKIGGAVYAFLGHLSSTQCLYMNNKASEYGGALFLLWSTANTTGDVFFNNTANTGEGSAIYHTNGSINLFNATFNANSMVGPSKTYTVQLTNVLGRCDGLTFTNNQGSLHLFNSGLFFSGEVSFTGNTGVTGGALTLVQSTVVFERFSQVNISNNFATYGGGSFLSRSTFTVRTSEFLIDSNTAMISGGGISSYQSEIIVDINEHDRELRNSAFFQRNRAVEGGAIHSISSSLNILHGHALFTSNEASKGGAVFLSQSSNIYIQKSSQENASDITVSLTFSNNTAEYGGALYILDASNTGVLCDLIPSSVFSSRSTRECFLQTLRLYHPDNRRNFEQSNYINIFFESNFARVSGNDIFGGLLDRCQSSSFAEVYNNFNLSSAFNGFNYIKTIAQFNIDVDYDEITRPFDPQHIARTIRKEHFNSLISSHAVQLCFCINESYDCSYKHPTIFSQRGERFSVQVITIDQVENPVNGTVLASVVSSGTRLKVDQSQQETNGVCTELFYNVFSTQPYATIQLYPGGPCDNVGISSKELNITFLPCECPNGLQPAPIDNECRCECDSTVDSIISQCLLDSDNLTIVRRSEDVWIQYVNNDTTTGFVYRECPFDYCLVEPVNLSFSLPSQVDTQCAYNRSGVMCGECEEGLSLVFGSSRCALCSNNYLALLIAFAVAGIALVVFILILNMTVAVGTIHGLILYANIVAANSPIFLPPQTALRVFVSWVNLDLGIETCFYDGMDSYAKVLLQLVFPVYVISLSALIIVVSYYWGWFAGLIGRKNPVATLCTLFLLSYSKLLQTIIASLQFTHLTYPSGETDVLWLYNPNILYFTPARIPMFIIAGIIIILGAIYTILLFFGQWLRKQRNIKCLRSHKYNTFIDAYHSPFSFKHRYWIGVLLLTRIIHHLLTAVLSESTHLLMVSCLVCILLILKQVITKVYKNWLFDLLETSFLINLLLFAVSTYYVSLTNRDQVAVANTSVAIAFITFSGIVLFHSHTFCLMSFEAYKKFIAQVKNCFETTKRRLRTTTVPDHIVETTHRNMLREPALDIIAPLTSQDYGQYVPPTTPTHNRPVTSTTVDVNN